MPAVAEPDTARPSSATEETPTCQFIGIDADEICRVCGCTPDRPCTKESRRVTTWTCGWAEPGLCTACTPGAMKGWVHPPREELGCQEDAEFEIHDRGCPGDPPCYSCVEHVGHLLGHNDPAPDDADDRWEVVGI